MIWPVFRKDWILLWPFVALLTLIEAVLEWSYYRFGFFGSSTLARELLGVLQPAWLIGTLALSVAVVQEDTIPGVDQDWLIRPIARTDLLLAKMMFVLAAICLPMATINLADELAYGFPFGPSLVGAVYNALYVFVCLWVPAMALASAARNMTDVLLLLSGLVVLYAVLLSVAALLFGTDRCPTCDTSVAWLQHQLQHGGVLIGSLVVLALQYYRRNTRLSRIVLAVGVVGLVSVQLTWNTAFAIQTWLSAPIGTPPAAIRIEADPIRPSGLESGRRAARGGARQATRALLHGDVDSAVLNFATGSQRPPVVLAVPLRVSGLANDEFLVVDHAVYALLDADGRVLYSDASPERHSLPLIPAPGKPDLLAETFEVPAPAYARLAGRAAGVRVQLWLTVRAMVSEHRIRAVNGEVDSPEIGHCRSRSDRLASTVRCRHIGRVPNCLSAILYGPDGTRNPPVYACNSDYRPFIPPVTNIVQMSGIDLPISDPYAVAHYEVDSSNVADAEIAFKVYQFGAHFTRTVLAPLEPPAGERSPD
jgi:hypothetical protein